MEGLLELRRWTAGEEAEPAQVDAENGHGALVDETCGAKQSAVTAEREHRVHVRGLDEGGAVAGDGQQRLLVRELQIERRGEPVKRRQDLREVAVALMADDADAN